MKLKRRTMERYYSVKQYHRSRHNSTCLEHRVTDGSVPCAVTTWGLDKAVFFNANGIDPTDIEGNDRDDALWSMGACEYDGSCMQFMSTMKEQLRI